MTHVSQREALEDMDHLHLPHHNGGDAARDRHYQRVYDFISQHPDTQGTEPVAFRWRVSNDHPAFGQSDYWSYAATSPAFASERFYEVEPLFTHPIQEGDGEWLTQADIDEVETDARNEGYAEGQADAQGAAGDLFKSMVADLQKRGTLLSYGSEGEECTYTADDVMQAYFEALREASLLQSKDKADG